MATQVDPLTQQAPEYTLLGNVPFPPGDLEAIASALPWGRSQFNAVALYWAARLTKKGIPKAAEEVRRAFPKGDKPTALLRQFKRAGIKMFKERGPVLPRETPIGEMGYGKQLGGARALNPLRDLGTVHRGGRGYDPGRNVLGPKAMKLLRDDWKKIIKMKELRARARELENAREAVAAEAAAVPATGRKTLRQAKKEMPARSERTAQRRVQEAQDAAQKKEIAGGNLTEARRELQKAKRQWSREHYAMATPRGLLDVERKEAERNWGQRRVRKEFAEERRCEQQGPLPGKPKARPKTYDDDE